MENSFISTSYVLRSLDKIATGRARRVGKRECEGECEPVRLLTTTRIRPLSGRTRPVPLRLGRSGTSGSLRRPCCPIASFTKDWEYPSWTIIHIQFTHFSFQFLAKHAHRFASLKRQYIYALDLSESSNVSSSLVSSLLILNRKPWRLPHWLLDLPFKPIANFIPLDQATWEKKGVHHGVRHPLWTLPADLERFLNWRRRQNRAAGTSGTERGRADRSIPGRRCFRYPLAFSRLDGVIKNFSPGSPYGHPPFLASAMARSHFISSSFSLSQRLSIGGTPWSELKSTGLYQS